MTSDLLSGQYSNPVRVISFNIVEGWSRDVSREVAEDLLLRSEIAMQELPVSLRAFVESRPFRKPDGFRNSCQRALAKTAI